VSTQINVTVGSVGLSDKVKQLQTAARQAQLEKERQQRIEAQGAEQRTAKLEAEGKAPDGSPLYGARFKQPQIERRPAASRLAQENYIYRFPTAPIFDTQLLFDSLTGTRPFLRLREDYIIYKNNVGAISKIDTNSSRNIIIGQPRINWNEELEMKDNMSIYRIDDVIPFIIEDIYELTRISEEITYEMIFNFLEKAGFNLYNTDNYMTGKSVVDMYNKLKQIVENPVDTIECCICYTQNTIDNIIITRCCKNLYCKNCIMRLKKCSVCSRDF
jgi:hypothetical protein